MKNTARKTGTTEAHRPQLRESWGRWPTPKAPRPPPRQGEPTREVLAEYGFSDAEIAAVIGRSLLHSPERC